MKRKKIAILTQPLGHNYGGLLQNYALQKVLMKKGFDVETIAREYPKRNFFIQKLYLLKNNIYNRIFGKYKKIINYPSEFLKEVKYNMDRFLSSKINLSEKIYSTEELSKYFQNNRFDIVIVGSDQTWRRIYSPKITNYYLDFLQNNNDIKKISYASSFGTEYWEYSKILTKKCKSLIKTFDAISVREESGVELCKDKFGIESVCVLDPTLLLNADDYKLLFSDGTDGNISEGNIVVYMLDIDLEKRNFVRYLANELNKGVHYNQPIKSLENDYGKIANVQDFKYPGPEEWLLSFYNADFIITDSFHGTVFSVLFNKPFFSIVNKERGAARFYSLLNNLGLENRIIEDMKNFDYNLLKHTIDYKKVNIKLKELRKYSEEFLENNLK